MFDDLIEKKDEKIKETNDSIIDALKDNIRYKEELIAELIDDVVNRDIKIDQLERELEYLRNL